MLIGEPLTWRDAVAVAAMSVVYPFGEWAIHVYLLHAKPIELRGRRFELPTTRDHRDHHRQPNNLFTLLLDPKELAELLLLAVPAVVLVGGLVVGLVAGAVPWAALLSAAITGYVLVGVYEWTHYLIHTAYGPRSRAYRSVWRNHRLHHFKNEHYWHGITNTLADRVLGTFPTSARCRARRPRGRWIRAARPRLPASSETRSRGPASSGSRTCGAPEPEASRRGRGCAPRGTGAGTSAL